MDRALQLTFRVTSSGNARPCADQTNLLSHTAQDHGMTALTAWRSVSSKQHWRLQYQAKKPQKKKQRQANKRKSKTERIVRSEESEKSEKRPNMGVLTDLNIETLDIYTDTSKRCTRCCHLSSHLCYTLIYAIYAIFPFFPPFFPFFPIFPIFPFIHHFDPILSPYLTPFFSIYPSFYSIYPYFYSIPPYFSPFSPIYVFFLHFLHCHLQKTPYEFKRRPFEPLSTHQKSHQFVISIFRVFPMFPIFRFSVMSEISFFQD